jgi:hypothetical protein
MEKTSQSVLIRKPTLILLAVVIIVTTIFHSLVVRNIQRSYDERVISIPIEFSAAVSQQ